MLYIAYVIYTIACCISLYIQWYIQLYIQLHIQLYVVYSYVIFPDIYIYVFHVNDK